MQAFGLTPEQVVARSDANALDRAPTLSFSLLYGAVSFAAVAVIGYTVWAYKLIAGTAAMYSTIAAIFIGGTGFALSRLVIGRQAAGRFAALFALAFLLYTLAWCAAWFGLKGKYQADLWGAAVGLALMAGLVQGAFGARGEFLPAFAMLFTFHMLGYYLGGVLHAVVPGATGKLLYGAAHGAGFGAGMGAVLYYCQRPIRSQLAERPVTATYFQT